MTAIDESSDLRLQLQADKTSWLVENTTALYNVSDLASSAMAAARHNHVLTQQESSNNVLERNGGISISGKANGTEMEEDIMWSSSETTSLLSYIDQNYSAWHSGNKTKFYKQLISEVLKNRNPTQVKNKVHKLLAKYHKIRAQKASGGAAPNWTWYARMDQVFGQHGHTPSNNLLIMGDPKPTNNNNNNHNGVESSDDSEENKRPTKRRKRLVTQSSQIVTQSSQSQPPQSLPLTTHTTSNITIAPAVNPPVISNLDDFNTNASTASSCSNSASRIIQPSIIRHVNTGSSDWLETYLKEKLAAELRELEIQNNLKKDKMQYDFQIEKERMKHEFEIQNKRVEVEKINAENAQKKLNMDLEHFRILKMQLELQVKEAELKLHQQQL
ncbi:5319_t:CDS:2 [Ambispora gerdemannii]|uniref:5319_t:CDS:1 n=1 Tax=Ambispora gerdemannii TaxID=144530 RepID=A0A9N8ZX75_9GLOM|nr:5319_t:CDS:2 [Ambispora gerdemannii]